MWLDNSSGLFNEIEGTICDICATPILAFIFIVCAASGVANHVLRLLSVRCQDCKLSFFLKNFR